jgi:hypothetical protein
MLVRLSLKGAALHLRYQANSDKTRAVLSLFANMLSHFGVDESYSNKNKNLKADFLVIQQMMPSKKILEIPEYKLIRNTFSDSKVQLFGFKVTNSLHGYQYALCEKE